MPTLPGRCVNTANCAAAVDGEIVHASAAGRYACPSCGKTLVPPTTKLRMAPGGSRLLRDTGGSSGLLVASGGLLGGMLLGALLLGDGPIVGLSREALVAAPLVNVVALHQPHSMTAYRRGQ